MHFKPENLVGEILPGSFTIHSANNNPNVNITLFPVPQAINLDVLFGSNVSLSGHISSVTKCCFYIIGILGVSDLFLIKLLLVILLPLSPIKLNHELKMADNSTISNLRQLVFYPGSLFKNGRCKGRGGKGRERREGMRGERRGVNREKG